MRVLLIALLSVPLFGVQPDQKTLPIGLAPFEQFRNTGDAPLTSPPKGPVISLPEWEVSKGVMVLWTNPSLIKVLKENGALYLFADSNSEKSWWSAWLKNNAIPEQGVNYFVVPTDSIWIRDYGPWFILDGNREFGLVDTKYNRPRPLDDQVPIYIANELGIPYYQPGLVHTGGNYYNDGLGNGFSSTLPFSENASISTNVVLDRMLQFLGIERYTTARLSPGSTIQHLDTFGKLVAPDTWVFSQFPAGSQHKTDSDNMVKLLQTLKSPYGTPYKIHRLKMTSSGGGGFRAYLNSFISNGVLYFPQYGDLVDAEVKSVYQKALPGYKIVGVDAMGTEWGDSVHCRTRNMLTPEALFLFPRIAQPSAGSLELKLEALPSKGASIQAAPLLNYTVNGEGVQTVSFQYVEKNNWKLELSGLNSGDKITFWISAQDSKGVRRTEPRLAPEQRIEVEVSHARF